LPAAYKSAVGTRFLEGLGYFSVSISVVLLVVYVLFLVFSLITHKSLFVGSFDPEGLAFFFIPGAPTS
jgi:Ca2+:H+ antiporter